MREAEDLVAWTARKHGGLLADCSLGAELYRDHIEQELLFIIVMLQIKEIVNSVFSSKTYILFKQGENNAWLVDIGDVDPVLSFLGERNLVVKGILITHAHFDHIYGIEAMVDQFPECKVYTCEYAKHALASDKLNMSKYYELGAPIRFLRDNVVVVKDGESMELFDGEPKIVFYETPGHNPGCLTMVVGDKVFTGDAYIPGIGVNTVPPKSDKKLARESLERILKLAEGRIVLPGHVV